MAAVRRRGGRRAVGHGADHVVGVGAQAASETAGTITPALPGGTAGGRPSRARRRGSTDRHVAARRAVRLDAARGRNLRDRRQRSAARDVLSRAGRRRSEPDHHSAGRLGRHDGRHVGPNRRLARRGHGDAVRCQRRDWHGGRGGNVHRSCDHDCECRRVRRLGRCDERQQRSRLGHGCRIHRANVGHGVRHHLGRRPCRRFRRQAAGRGGRGQHAAMAAEQQRLGPLGRDHVRAAPLPVAAAAGGANLVQLRGNVVDRRCRARSYDDSPSGSTASPSAARPRRTRRRRVATDPGTCRYGMFDGVDDYVEIADNAALDITSRAHRGGVDLHAHDAVGAAHDRVEGHELRVSHRQQASRVLVVERLERQHALDHDDDADRAESVAPRRRHLPVGRAAHVHQRRRCKATTGNYTGTLAARTRCRCTSARIGTSSRARSTATSTRCGSSPTRCTQAEVQALRDETHPCANSARFTITHNAFGIHCVAETMTVNVVDSIAGTPLLNYNAPVQLDTQSGYGTWALVTGSGAFSDGTAGDGIATYTWPLGQSQAHVHAVLPARPAVDRRRRLSDEQHRYSRQRRRGCARVLAERLHRDGRGAREPAGRVTPFATNQTAGTNFALHLAAYGQTPTDPVCGIIEGYTGAKSLKFWSQYVDPGTGTRNVTIDGVAAAATRRRGCGADRHVHERPGGRDGEVQGRRPHPPRS